MNLTLSCVSLLLISLSVIVNTSIDYKVGQEMTKFRLSIIVITIDYKVRQEMTKFRI